jgi:putative membrane protein
VSEHLGAIIVALLPLAHWVDGGSGMGWGIAMLAAMVLFWVVLIGAAVWLVRYLVGERDRPGARGQGPGEAVRILERRFAAGEIDADEYRERHSTLKGGG